ncbi:MAG: enoyl-CoA hydratase-related protein [Pseudomonadota bacterium]
MPTITTTLERGWLTIRLAQPNIRNALTDEMVLELTAELNRAATDVAIRGITFHGEGEVFCAGGDLKGFQKTIDADSVASITDVSKRAGALFHLINEMPQVVVMCVHGAAIAGGMGMMAAGDVVITTQDAKFALTETQLGIVPAQIAPLVLQRVGPATARRLMLTGARFDGEHAAAIGLADFVVEDATAMMAKEADIRRDVFRCAPGAVAATKQLLRHLTDRDKAAVIEHAADVFAGRLGSDEGREGIASFIEKRKPEWAE